MSVSAWGFCVTNNKDVFDVVNRVKEALTTFVRSRSSGKRFDKDNQIKSIDISVETKMAGINFTVNGEKRILNIMFDCDSSGSEISKGKKILWTVNKWGSSEEIMFAVGLHLRDLGPVYIDLDDCDSIPYATVDSFEGARKMALQRKMEHLFDKTSK